MVTLDEILDVPAFGDCNLNNLLTWICIEIDFEIGYAIFPEKLFTQYLQQYFTNGFQPLIYGDLWHNFGCISFWSP